MEQRIEQYVHEFGCVINLARTTNRGEVNRYSPAVPVDRTSSSRPPTPGAENNLPFRFAASDSRRSFKPLGWLRLNTAIAREFIYLTLDQAWNTLNGQRA